MLVADCRQSVVTSAGQRSSAIRLLTLATLFPNAFEPRRGIFIANRLERICRRGDIEATVLAALPWFPGSYRQSKQVPRADAVRGIPVRHPRYFHWPMVGMRMQPDSLARALLKELSHAGLGGGDFDVVDAHYFYPDGVAAARIARELDLPLVISARGSDINLIGNIAFARERMVCAANAAEALIAVSSSLAAKMTELGMPADRIHVLRNGVDDQMFFPVPKQEARRAAGIDEAGTWVLGVGHWVAEKGFELLIQAVSRLRDVRLLLIGGGPLESRLRVLAQTLAPGRVDFRNNVSQPQLRLHYAACDVLGVPSLREGWPNVVLEAIACGTPVVASAVGGIPEILGPEAPGTTVSTRDASVWAEALHKTLSSHSDPERVRHYAKRFGWDEVVARQCALYRHVAERRRPVPSAGAN